MVELPMQKTIKIRKDTYTNDINMCRITKNDETYKNYAILNIEEDGTIITKSKITIGSFNINDIPIEEEYQEIIEAFKEDEQKPTKTTKKVDKKTKKDE